MTEPEPDQDIVDWPDSQLHPLLSEQLRQVALRPDARPSSAGWRALLSVVSSEYASSGQGDDRQSPDQQALTELARAHGQLIDLGDAIDPDDVPAVEAVAQDCSAAIVLVGADARILAVSSLAQALMSPQVDVVGRPLCDAIALQCTTSDPPLQRSNVLRVIRAGKSIRAARGQVTCAATHPVEAHWRLGQVTLTDGRVGAALILRTSESIDPSWNEDLIGLPGTRTLHSRLNVEVDRASRLARPISLLLLDVDGLGTINDCFGQEFGDRVIGRVARALSAQAGPNDLLAFIGGGTFAWVMPRVDAVSAYTAAERTRTLSAAAARELIATPAVTLSAGICDLRDADTATEIYRYAEIALSWAKSSGRDRTVRYSAELASRLAPMRDGTRADRQRPMDTIRALARAVDAKDASTFQHSERVAALSVRLASALTWPVPRIALLAEAAMVHDVGKIGIPDAVLFKPGPLTPVEYALVKEHAELGATIVEGVLSTEQAEWVRQHHERVDGRGYPDGAKDHEISEGAQIIAVADAWDSMVSERPYRAAISHDDAIQDCLRQAGHQFSRRLVMALVRLNESGSLRHHT